MQAELDIALPPEGMLIRDLTLTALVHMLGTLDLELLHDKVVLSASTQAKIDDCFRSLYGTASNVIRKRARMRVGMIKNDQQVLSRLLNKDIEGYTYLDAFKDFLDARRVTSLNLPSLGRLAIDEKSITLGGGKYAALNLLISEKYERGTEFWRLNYRSKLDVRLDEEWYSLILAGLSLTMSAYVDDDVIITYFPEDFVRAASRLGELPMIPSILPGLHEKISDIVHNSWSNVEPFTAFVLFIAFNLAKDERVSDVVSQLRRLPLAICRLRRSGNVFTMIDKRRAELFDALRLAYRAQEKAGPLYDRLIRICSEALRTAELGAEFTIYNRFCTLLYQAVHGAYDPYEVVYYGARHGLFSGKRPAEGVEYIKQEVSAVKRLTEALLDALTS